MHKLTVSSVHAKVNEKQRQKRNGLEKRIREAVKINQNMNAVLDCAVVQIKMITNNSDGDVSGKQFIHVWYHKMTKVDVVWNGRIIKMDCEDTCVVIYWGGRQ